MDQTNRNQDFPRKFPARSIGNQGREARADRSHPGSTSGSRNSHAYTRQRLRQKNSAILGDQSPKYTPRSARFDSIEDRRKSHRNPGRLHPRTDHPPTLHNALQRYQTAGEALARSQSQCFDTYPSGHNHQRAMYLEGDTRNLPPIKSKPTVCLWR